MYFEAIEDFWSDEVQSQYVTGFRYTARTDGLKRLVEKWCDEGLVKIVDAPGSTMQGKE